MDASCSQFSAATDSRDLPRGPKVGAQVAQHPGTMLA